MADDVVVVQQLDRRDPDPLRRLEHRGPEHLLSERPVVRGSPSREVTRGPHLGGHHQRVLGPRCGIRRLHRHPDVEPPADSPDPAVLSPPGQLLRRCVGVDVEGLDDIGGRDEPVAESEQPSQLRPDLVR